MSQIPNGDLQKYLNVLIRIDEKSVALRRALARLTRRSALINTTNRINELYIEIGDLIDEALKTRDRWLRSPGGRSEHGSQDEPPSAPPPVMGGDPKEMMMAGEALGSRLVRLFDTGQYAEAKAECLRMCRQIDRYTRGRR